MSAFLLLALGITFSGFLLLCEHGYFRYLRKYLAHFRNTAWCNLISIGNLLERLAFRPLKMLCLDDDEHTPSPFLFSLLKVDCGQNPKSI